MHRSACIIFALAILGLLPAAPAARAGLGTAVSSPAVIDSRPPLVELDTLGEHLLIQAGQTLQFHWTHFDDNPGVNLASYWARLYVDGDPIASKSWFPGPAEFTWTWTAPEIQSPFCRLAVLARDAFGNETLLHSEDFTVLFSTTDTPPDVPLLQVGPASPNPFNPACRLDLSLGRAGHVTVSVFDTRGHRLRTLLDLSAPAGPLTVTWTGTDDKGRPQPGGLYLFAVEVESAGQVRRELRKAVLLP